MATEKERYEQVVQKLRDFINTPTPTNATDYTQVCQTLIDDIAITNIFASLIACPQSFKTISTAIRKIFSSQIGCDLLRNDDVLKWLISGLKQSSNPQYEALNILSIDVIHCALQSDKDVEYWITAEKSSLFLWCLSLISSSFESSFQKLEKIIVKHGANALLLQTLFSENVIQMLLNIKDQNKNENSSKADKGTMRFRAHALWIDALNAYYSNLTNAKSEDDDIEMKNNDNDIIQLYINSGLFKDLLQLLQTDDVLIQINVLPLLSTLSNFETGLELLLKHNVVQVLIQLLKTEDAILLGKEIYKVLVQMIRNTKNIYVKRKTKESIEWLNDNKLFEIIKVGFNSYDVAVKESCCLFVGLFCSFANILKKMIILNESNERIPVRELCGFVNDLKINPSAENQQLAVAAIHGLCDIFAVNNEGKDVDEFLRSLLDELQGMQKLHELLKHPEDEMRFSVFRLMNNICSHEWGVMLLNNCGGLFEYLTDRNEADIMLGFQWKYTVLETLFKNKNTKNVFNKTHQEQLTKYMKEGVVFQSKADKKKNKQENVVQVGWEQF